MSMVVRRTIIVAAILLFVVAVLINRALAAVSTPTKILTNAKNPIVWQRFGQWLMITEDLPTGRTCYFHDPAHRSKMLFKKPLKGAWQPLGSAVKWLMYIDNVNGLDRLMAHDVDRHVYCVARSSAQRQVGAGMVDTRCIFGQYRAGRVGDHYAVDLYCINMIGGAVTQFYASDSEKSQFAHDGSLLVYRAYLGNGDYRILGAYFNQPGEFEIAARNGVEPSVCGNLVAWAEADGAGWNIVAKNLQTGEIRGVARTTANPPCPEAGNGAIFWQDARNKLKTGIDIYGYDWATGMEFPVSVAAGDQIKLRVCGDLITWASGLVNYQTLWMAKYSR